MTEPKPRGLAALSPERRREIAKMGGQSKGHKGLAAMSPKKRREIARMGGLKKQANQETTK